MSCLYFFQLSLFLFLKFDSWRSSSISFIASFYFLLHHIKSSVLNLNEFSGIISKNSVRQPPNPHWPEMAALGSPWPSIGSLGMAWPSVSSNGVSKQARSARASKDHRLNHNCEELLLGRLRRLLLKLFLINHDFLILHDVENRFSKDAFFSGIAALTTFKRNASSVDGGPCGIKALKVFCR